MRPDPAAGGAPTPAEGELLRASDRVVALLEELRAMVGPTAWLRVEELVRELLLLHGEGLERILDHAEAVEREAGAVEARLRSDALVTALLLLHGLVEEPAIERGGRAGGDPTLVRLRPPTDREGR